jgi:hypothetical protein
MVSACDTLYKWARRTAQADGDALVYRLRHWPELQARHRTAEIYKALSLMSNRPVNRGWFLRHSRIKAKELDGLLDRLVMQGAVEIVDVSNYK